MNLTLLQFRTEVLRFRAALAVWWGLLLVDLAINAGWIGHPPVRQDNAGSQLFLLACRSIDMACWLLLAMLPAWVALVDSPARRDRFLAARPMPGADVWRAKSLFLLTLIVLPVVVQETAYLLFQGVPVSIVAHAAIEKLVFTTVIVAGSAAFAALWAGFQQLIAAMAVVVGAFVAAAFLLDMAIHVLKWPVRSLNFDRDPATFLVFNLAVALALVCVAVLNARRQWGIRGRSVGLLSACGIVIVILWAWPDGVLDIRPANPAAAAGVVKKSTLRVPFSSFSVTRETNRVQFQFTPQITPPPARNRVLIQATQLDAVWADGSRRRLNLPWRPRGPVALFQGSWESLAPADKRCLSALLPGNPDWISTLNSGFSQDFITVAGTLDITAVAGREKDPFTLQSGLTADVYSYEIAADIALESGASARTHTARWSVTRVDADSNPEISLWLDMAHVKLLTGRDEDTSQFRGGGNACYSYALYFPAKNLVVSPDFASSMSTLGNRSAWARQTLNLRYRMNRFYAGLIGSEDMRQARLLVFRSRWLGSAPCVWDSPSMVWQDIPERSDSYHANPVSGEQMSRSDFYRRLAAIPAPGAGCTRAEAGRYLAEMLSLVAARQSMPDEYEPVVQQVILLLSNHCDLVIDAFALSDYRGRHLIERGLIRGLEETQKGRILDALKRAPGLAGVVWERGWLEDARGELLRLARQPGVTLDFKVLVALKDASLHPVLLDAFESSPSDYRLWQIQQVPGIEPALGATMDRLWARRPRGPDERSEWMTCMSVQAAYGRTEAFRELYRWQQVAADDYQRQEIRRKLMELIHWTEGKPLARWDDSACAARLKEHRAEDFQFDPAWRGYVLKTNGATP
jgi:hypothetical protein